MTPFLAADIKTEEGLRLQAYPDPLTRGAPWTIGYGSTGPGITEGVTWTLAQAQRALDARIAVIIAGFDHALPWWRGLSDPRQDVLVQMAYQLGVGGVLCFQHMLDALQAGDWSEAAAAMGASKWARQTTAREQRMAAQLLTNDRHPM